MDIKCQTVIAHILNCETCMDYLIKYRAQVGGSSITKKKSNASRLNGLKGGRPKKLVIK